MPFIVDTILDSIFTPGPTPPLLLATNATFFCLQLLLLALLFATWSIHFFVLSVLCAGLWTAINWFAAEVIAVQEKMQEEQEDETGGKTVKNGRATGANRRVDSEDDDGAPQPGVGRRRKRKTTRSIKDEGDSGTETEDMASSHLMVETRSKKGSISTSGRRSSVSDVSGTDSEWDKVESEVEVDG